ncbi:MAG: hypothetical protein R3E08_10605 [Thiotrichaceae bacterium]
MLDTEERVNHLDELMAQLIQTVDRTSKEMRRSYERSQRDMQDFREEMRLSHENFEREMRLSREKSEREMHEFKTEMRLSREKSEQEMHEFKTEMRLSREKSEQEMHEFRTEMRLSRENSEREMHEFKTEMRLSREKSEQEMHEFKTEMHLSREKSEQEIQAFKVEMRQSKRDLNKKWGELSNKLGTMAEDLVAPSVPQILRQLTGCSAEIEYSAVRVHKSKPQNQEFDVVVKCENWIFINETKSTLRPEHIDNFHRLMQNIRDYFPEFKENQFIGAIASLYVDEALVKYGEKLGLVVLGFGEELMDVLNSAEFTPKLF